MFRAPMYVANWINKIVGFLRLSDREILTHAGKISHGSAKERTEVEFAQFKEQQLAHSRTLGKQLLEAIVANITAH